MKCFLTLVLLALLALVFWTYRSRVRTTFKAVALAYLIITAVNIVRVSGDDQGSETVLLVLVGSALLWGLGWVGVSLWTRWKANGHTH